jgi:hypothetical protein
MLLYHMKPVLSISRLTIVLHGHNLGLVLQVFLSHGGIKFYTTIMIVIIGYAIFFGSE